ncbi:MAG: hypothetical protein KAY65_12910 [Planctomycetes bacterium]|nr:hypothetical protein [Planctomycetota bacterium]
MISEAMKQSAQSDQAARRERLSSPEVIQKSRAVRHPENGIVRLAKTKESATDNDHITCNLLDMHGSEITSGWGAGIEVYCTIMNGAALNEAAPRLETNKLLPVSYIYDHWRCTTVFDTDEECVCEEPP